MVILGMRLLRGDKVWLQLGGDIILEHLHERTSSLTLERPVGNMPSRLLFSLRFTPSSRRCKQKEVTDDFQNIARRFADRYRSPWSWSGCVGAVFQRECDRKIGVCVWRS